MYFEWLSFLKKEPNSPLETLKSSSLHISTISTSLSFSATQSFLKMSLSDNAMNKDIFLELITTKQIVLSQKLPPEFIINIKWRKL